MKLSEIFAKDVQRPIEGVIKADDTAHLGNEVEEYVLTNEAAKALGLLLDAYTNYTNANGVWISGFFGSGKSHLLKMLAHLLGDVEDQAFEREDVSASFLGKASDAFLPGLLTKAARIPAKSLLFNIDQKATLISKDQSDALLKVFVKVFDESRGYYGNQGHIARFERDLDNRGQYELFKTTYGRISGRDWAKGREEGVLEESNVAQAYAEVSGQTDSAPTNILTKYRNEYSVSIEDFADEVQLWLGKQEAGFRLNFFVDEVGQFIGSNTHLMLNLQTIAESLNSKCQGRAWIFVTSQEDMDKVVGDRTKQQGNDFSKIQARFATKVKLTSADVEEVIRKRLLEKNEAGALALRKIYAVESANFKTLFDFVDGAKTYKSFTDESHFIGTYPFVGYQFPLFQEAIMGISDHNVFEGRNSSVGERSMLGVVQQVAKDIGDVELGTLATFDHMFAGIRASLKSAAQRSIDVSERNLDNDLAKRLLKALFLVKYVEGFNATARNLTVLVYDKFGLDLPDLAKRVQEALTLLEVQTYAQRNGNVYEYLTNEEQVIEEEIKNVDIDSSEVSSRLFKILSTDVIRTNKFRYSKNGQDFSFGYKLDDQVFGQARDLTLHFITPAYPFGPAEIRMHSAGKDELRVVLNPDDRVLSDLNLLIKTEKYAKRKQTTSITANEDHILRSKAAQNMEREKELIERIRLAVGKGELVINAADVSSSAQEAIARVEQGFQNLVARTFTQLSLLGGVTYSEQQVAEYASPDKTGLIDESSVSKLSTPGEEVLSHVLRRDKLGEQVTVKSIVETFQTKPYGWDLASIEVVVAWLIGTSKVTLTIDGNSLKGSELATAIRNTQKQAFAVVAPQKTFDERKVANLRAFATDFFDEASAPRDPLELARHCSDGFKAKLGELNATVAGSKYPFVIELNVPIALLTEVVGKSDEWYLSVFSHGDELLDAKNGIIDPIKSFLGGGQSAIYDDAANLLSVNRSNLSYLLVDSAADVAKLLNDPQAFRGNRMAQLRVAADELRALLEKELVANRLKASSEIEGRKSSLMGSTVYANSDSDAQLEVTRQIDHFVTRIGAEHEIGIIRELANGFAESTYPSLLDQLSASAIADADGGSVPLAVKPAISVKKIVVKGMPSLLETPDDVDRYVDALRSALNDALNDGKRIAL
jgi:hypothetical protein